MAAIDPKQADIERRIRAGTPARMSMFVDDIALWYAETVRYGLGRREDRTPFFPPSPERVTRWYWKRQN